jgi:hypothetical protein
MNLTNQLGVWAATAFSLIVAVGLTSYLIYAFKRGVITFPSRFPSDYTRIVNPGMFWFAAVMYLIWDGFSIVCFLMGAYRFLEAVV